MCRSAALVAARTCRLTLIVATLACTDPRAVAGERFTLELRAASASGQPVAGARFWADGDDLGVSNNAGTLRSELRGRAGQHITLTIACPTTYRTLVPRRRIALQQRLLQVQSACEPVQHFAVIVVRARAGAPLAGVPIRKDGELVGQTDLDGTAHLLLKSRPAASLRIALDTAAWPELVPRDPVQSYELGDEDSIVLVDQSFALRERRREAHRPARRPPSAAPRLPYRIR